MAGRRGFGELEKRTSRSGVSYRARYAMPAGTRYSRSFRTKLDAEGWLSNERSLIDRDEWSPPAVHKQSQERREREAATNTVAVFAERYLSERGLRPNTVRLLRSILQAAEEEELIDRVPPKVRGPRPLGSSGSPSPPRSTSWP